MNDKLVNWTHWFECLPGYALKCIIIKKRFGLLHNYVKIFTDEGYIVDCVDKRYLIEMN